MRSLASAFSLAANQVAVGQPLLVLQNLRKDFDGALAVDDVSVTINKGEIFALLGSSGCGKSTLLRMLAGFELPSAGQITLAGQNLVGVAPYERPINMMFQSYALFPHLSVWDNIAFGLRRDGLPKQEIAQRVQQMLDLVQLSPYAKRRPYQLSGGQQQRVALARSLAKRPQLLLLDEPLGALDKKLRERTQLELVNIIEQVGVTCVLVTHDQEEAMTVATRIAVMSEGRILQLGRPDDIYESPNCRFVADFIGSVNLFDGHVVESTGAQLRVDSAHCQHVVSIGTRSPVGMQVGMQLALAIRPEKITLSRSAPAQTHNCVQGEVLEIAYLGSTTVYHLRLASGMVLKATTINHARHAAHPAQWGDHLFASWGEDASVVLTQ